MGKYVVVDLEMCKVPRGMKSKKYHYGTETIQIGAALLDETYEVVDTFNTYVMPENGWIDCYIENLTGIDWDKVKEAPIMECALKEFLDWIPEDAKIVSWSNADQIQIQHEVEAKHICVDRLNEVLSQWIDAQKIFGELLEAEQSVALANALIMADIEIQGREHDGLADAYNTALLFAKMQKEPELKLNPIYEKAHKGDIDHLNYSLGNLLMNLDIACA